MPAGPATQRLRQKNRLNPGGGGCSEPRSRHSIPAWATETDPISKRNKRPRSEPAHQSWEPGGTRGGNKRSLQSRWRAGPWRRKRENSPPDPEASSLHPAKPGGPARQGARFSELSTSAFSLASDALARLPRGTVRRNKSRPTTAIGLGAKA